MQGACKYLIREERGEVEPRKRFGDFGIFSARACFACKRVRAETAEAVKEARARSRRSCEFPKGALVAPLESYVRIALTSAGIVKGTTKNKRKNRTRN